MRRLLTGTLVVGGLLLVVCLMAVNGQAKVVDEPTSAMQDITTNFRTTNNWSSAMAHYTHCG